MRLSAADHEGLACNFTEAELKAKFAIGETGLKYQYVILQLSAGKLLNDMH